MVKNISILILVLLVFEQINAEQYQIKFNHLTIENGLSNSSVMCIFQDKQGFMWFGTQDGLNRYDGYSFKVFKNDPEDSTSLSDNFIYSIFEDNAGTFFVETQTGKINKYEPLTESFKLISHDSIDFSNVRINSVLARYYENSDIVWSGGLSKQTGLIKTNTHEGDTTIYLHSDDEISSLSDNKVYSVFRDSRGIMWIGTANGLDRLNERTGKFTHYRNNANNINSLSNNWVWPIYEDEEGNLWIGTVKGGLNKFDLEKGTFSSYKNDSNNPNSINDDFIFSIYQDKSGLIWVGTNAGGVNYFNPSANVFEHHFNVPEDKNSLSNNSVLSMMVDNSGNYWIGTRNGGLNKFNYKSKNFTRYTQNSNKSNGLLSNSIQSLYQDRSGIIWIGTFSSGLNSYNPSSGIFSSYVHDPDNPSSISDNRIYTIIQDREGIIWIGTYAGGLNKLNRKSDKFEIFKNIESDSTSLSSNKVWALTEDERGNLWIGTFGGGLNYFDKSSNNFTRFKTVEGDPNSLGDNHVVRLFYDSRHILWVGTTKGLYKYVKEKNIFKNYSDKDGLSNNFVFGILEDIEGNLWISTNNGISRFNPNTEKFTNYHIEDGIQNNEFNQNAFAKDTTSGNLLFGGVDGFNVFNPAKLKGNTYVPQIVFTNFLRFNTDNKEGRPITEKGISIKKEINLTYKDNIIYFEFAALSFYNSHKNQYKYKLEGFNENWIQIQNEHDITFTNLSPGDYTLKIYGSNSDGIWNEEGANLFITVSPPWWRTNIAYAFYLIFIIGILYTIRRVEMNIRDKKAKLREHELLIIAGESEKRALRVENERKTKELEEARQMQLAMLPKEIPDFDNIEIAAFMRTATEVGGDYYDFILDESDTINVAFGDATGHGLQAGTMVTLIKGFFTSYAANSDIKSFFERSSKTIKNIKLGRILMAFSFLKINGRKLNYSSVGMPPMYYYNKSLGSVEEIVVEGMPLGAMATMPFYTEIKKELSPGDIILLFSDGIPEQMNTQQQMYDYPRFFEKFKELVDQSPQNIIDSVIESVDKWRGEQSQDDDISLMVIRIK